MSESELLMSRVLEKALTNLHVYPHFDMGGMLSINVSFDLEFHPDEVVEALTGEEPA